MGRVQLFVAIMKNQCVWSNSTQKGWKCVIIWFSES